MSLLILLSLSNCRFISLLKFLRLLLCCVTGNTNFNRQSLIVLGWLNLSLLLLVDVCDIRIGLVYRIIVQLGYWLIYNLLLNKNLVSLLWWLNICSSIYLIKQILAFLSNIMVNLFSNIVILCFSNNNINRLPTSNNILLRNIIICDLL